MTAISPDKLLLKTYRGDMLSINIKNTEDYYIDNILFSVALVSDWSIYIRCKKRNRVF